MGQQHRRHRGAQAQADQLLDKLAAWQFAFANALDQGAQVALMHGSLTFRRGTCKLSAKLSAQRGAKCVDQVSCDAPKKVDPHGIRPLQ
jgi:hypothetical protein